MSEYPDDDYRLDEVLYDEKPKRTPFRDLPPNLTKVVVALISLFGLGAITIIFAPQIINNFASPPIQSIEDRVNDNSIQTTNFPQTAQQASALFGGSVERWELLNSNTWRYRGGVTEQITAPTNQYCIHYPGGDDIGFLQINVTEATIYYQRQGFSPNECVDISQ